MDDDDSTVNLDLEDDHYSEGLNQSGRLDESFAIIQNDMSLLKVAVTQADETITDATSSIVTSTSRAGRQKQEDEDDDDDDDDDDSTTVELDLETDHYSVDQAGDDCE